MTQSVKIIPVELSEFRAASTAGGGTALTATLSLISIPFGSDYLSITPRNFAGAAVVQFALNPYLTIFYTTDAGTSITDVSDETQDGDATDIVLDLFPAAGTGYFYVGSSVPFRGVAITQGTSPQDAATVLTVNYWNSAWADISDSDGTDDSGDSMKLNGNVTWTVPADWRKKSLAEIGDTLPSDTPQLGVPMYWTRWQWTNAFHANTDVRVMQALNRSTAYAELLEGQTVEVGLLDRTVACVEALTNAGTANLIVNVAAQQTDEFE